MAALYGNTGNTNPYGVSPAVFNSFESSLPIKLQGLTPLEVSGKHGALIQPGTAPVVVIDAGSNVDVEATMKSHILVGNNSTVDFSSSATAGGKPVSLDITIGGGTNTIQLNKGADSVQATIGTDFITSGGGRDTIVGGSGHDLITGGGQSSIVGGTGHDTLIGGLQANARDTINSGGNDSIYTALGSNFITGTKNDTIDAGQAQDVIYAGKGHETIFGGVGSYIFGGGHSSISGGNGNMVQLEGHDTYVGGVHADTINVNGDSHASIQGGAGDLDINVGGGKTANDTLFGGSSSHSGVVTVHLADQFGTIKSEHLNKDGSTTLTFAGGETLHVHNVTLDFGNQSDKF